MSVNPVGKYLVYEDLPQYRGRPCGMKKLAPYIPYLDQRVKDVHPIRLPTPILLRKIQEQVYTGGITQLRLYLNPSFFLF